MVGSREKRTDLRLMTVALGVYRRILILRPQPKLAHALLWLKQLMQLDECACVASEARAHSTGVGCAGE